MIYARLNDLAQYSGPSDGLTECLRFLREHDLAALEPGRHDIDGDLLFVNIAEYETTAPENRFWEAHKRYLDLHVLFRGTERIDLNFTADMQQQDYVEEDDFLPLGGLAKASVTLTPGDFLLCWPQDAHRTAVAVREPEPVKKAIFKIKL